MTKAGPGIRFCDEYETLMVEFLRSLSAWSQLRGFEQTQSSRTRPPAITITPAEGQRNGSSDSYLAALWALRQHSRHCVFCEQTLRVYVNGGIGPTAGLTANPC